MAINCPVDTPLLQELYNNVKSKVKDYQELKTLVGLWWERESQKDPDFDYEVYPTPQEIDALLKERVSQKTESAQSERTISYTSKGKRTQVYTIEGTHIYNKDGKEVFAKDSVDRNKIYANLAVKDGRAVVVEIDGERYVVNNRNQIISVQTGKIMQWAETDSKRKAILDAAQEKFDDKATASVINTTPFSDEIEELTLEERGLGLAVDPNTLEAKADSAFGTPQRRRDAVNIIVNAIRSGFSYEYNQQRKNLQTRIANENNPDKAAELQEQLDNLTEDKAAATGIDNIIRRVRAMFNPANVTKARFPQNYEAIKSDFQRVDDNWETLLEEALDILKVTDNLDYYGDYTNINYDTPIDDESGDFYDDDSLKEEAYKDNWMEKARFVDQRDSLSQKVRKKWKS